MDTYFLPYQLGPDTRNLRIVVVSEIRFLREGLAEILERDPSLSVVGQYADLAAAIALTSAPDIVLVDAMLPDGPVAVAKTRRIAPDVRIIAFAVRETEANIIAWAEAGVIGYVPSSAAWAEVSSVLSPISLMATSLARVERQPFSCAGSPPLQRTLPMTAQSHSRKSCLRHASGRPPN